MSCDAPDDNSGMKRDVGLSESEQVAIGYLAVMRDGDAAV